MKVRVGSSPTFGTKNNPGDLESPADAKGTPDADAIDERADAIASADPLEAALAFAISEAAKAGRFDLVATIAGQLDARRRDREGVVDLDAARRAKR